MAVDCCVHFLNSPCFQDSSSSPLTARIQKLEKRFDHLAEPVDELLRCLDGAKGLVALLAQIDDQRSWIRGTSDTRSDS